MAEKCRNLLTWLERAFSCGCFQKIQVGLSSKIQQNLHLENFFEKKPKKFPRFIRQFLNAQ